MPPRTLTKPKKGQQKREKESFDQFYSNTYGRDRWINSLLPSLASEPPKVALLNKYSKVDVEQMLERKVRLMQSGLSQAALMRAAACGTAPERERDVKFREDDEEKFDDNDSKKSEAEKNNNNNKPKEIPRWENLAPLQEYRLTSG